MRLSLANEMDVDSPCIIIGAPYRDKDGLFNAVAVLDQGKGTNLAEKVDLPNYGVFDEKRVFDAGPMPGPVNIRGVRIGLPICEDIWGEAGICETLAESGAEILLYSNGSPYVSEKMDVRHQIVLRQPHRTELPPSPISTNWADDELVFDGGSFVFNPGNELAVQRPI